MLANINTFNIFILKLLNLLMDDNSSKDKLVIVLFF